MKTKNYPLLISMAFLAVMITSCQFSKKASLRKYEAVKDQQFDIIVVPGIQFQDTGWNRVLKGRIYWAKHLYDRGIAKNIMFSGSAVYTPYYEAEIMKMYAEKIGIPSEHIYTETKAEHSTENIYYSYKKARKLGFKTVALASDPFQTKMLRKFTKKRVSKDVPIIPFVIDTMKVIELTMIDPEIDFEKARKKDFKSIKEKESFWKRFRGTMGKRIDKTAYDTLSLGN
ncbi:MAG: YdcF family protein [Flavitalea sp.]